MKPGIGVAIETDIYLSFAIESTCLRIVDKTKFS